MSSSIINSIASLSAMGLVFGAGLAYASQKFAVEVDPRVEAINGVLPGANCGGCGFPGCGGLATAIVEGKAPINACPVGGSNIAKSIGEIMGVSAGEGEKKVAKVMCKGNCNVAKDKAIYEGITDCKAASMIQGGQKLCGFGCLGLGTCIRACKFDAISIVDGIAVIDKDKCVSCGKCVKECPKAIIAIAPYSQEVVVECSSKDFGKDVKAKCSSGCIGCGICVKNCAFEAITLENNVAKIDYSKCTQCMKCVEKCPTKVISGNLKNRKKAVIDEESCVGCTVCKKNCKFDAIEGELKEKHKVKEENCVGCGVCADKCPKKSIKLK